ncbi:YbjQ family protein [Psychrobacter aestuarii]|uniref:Heavy metal-binding domain-containing protein n=1 Tax=Psychrobacter aestuarii TaxID=556327 RepID=A0ABN0VU36_9GAMM|nr:heavy metal-binding domain-containing protein [Psychrobacter aestuarii]
MNDTLTNLLINYGPILVLIAVGWFFGRRHEQKHLNTLARDEASLAYISVSNERFYQPTLTVNTEGALVLGSVVIAQDYFKMFIARVLNFFGKNLTTYETLLERARREALLRLRQEAAEQGYDAVYGLRFEVTTLNPMGTMVEAIAYGTAVKSAPR